MAPVVWSDEEGQLYLFCSQKCLQAYLGCERRGGPEPGCKWGCWQCGKDIVDE